jgi:hypothetical protein
VSLLLTVLDGVGKMGVQSSPNGRVLGCIHSHEVCVAVVAIKSDEVDQVSLKIRWGLLVSPFTNIKSITDGKKHASLPAAWAAGGIELIVVQGVHQETLLML